MREMGLPVHWKTARLGEVTDIFKGGTPKRSVEKYFRGDIPWAIPTDITALDSALYINDTDTHISEEALGKSAARLLPEGTVLLTSRATIGETAIATVPMATNQGFANFICRDMLLNVYLAYYLRYIKKRLIDLAHGSTFKEITKGTLLNVEIPLPPLPEQRAIAHVLQTIQEAKAARQRELALERERKAALMDYLFSYGTKDEPRKQTEIGEIPESWEVVKLGQLCRVFSGYAFKTKDYTKEGIPLIKIGNLQDGEVVINLNNDYMLESWQQKEQLQKFILKSRDILIALTGATTGKTAVVPPSLAGTFLNQRVGKIELVSPNAEQDFILVAIKTRFFQEAIQQNILRSAQGNISPSSIAQIPIPLPLLPEQRTIAGVFQAIDEKTAALKGEAEHMDELFHAMLDELMTGQRSAVPLIDAELPN